MNTHFPISRFVQQLLLWLGVTALAYAGSTAVYAEGYQRYAAWKFEGERAAPPIPTLPAMEALDLRDGDPVGKIEIPRIGISVMVLQGTEEFSLSYGAGHVPGTPLPGATGNVAIAAHRDTFFRGLKEIQRGDRIRFSTMRHTFEYVVDSMETVDPDDTRVIESRDYPELTLITCYPFYFVGAAPKRLIVHALPVETTP